MVVLIPYISGLSFGGSLRELDRYAERCLNPLYLGAIFRGQRADRVAADHRVLIPYISGLSFGEMTDRQTTHAPGVLIPYISGLSFGGWISRATSDPTTRLNPLYLGAIFRGSGCARPL